MRVFLVMVFSCLFIISCGKFPQTFPSKQKPAPTTAGESQCKPDSKPKSSVQIQQEIATQQQVEPKEQIIFPEHKFSPSSRPGRSKAQIRAIVELGCLNEADFKRTAVNLCVKYKSRAAGSFLVQFFSDSSCLAEWDGTGLLRDSDWPYWLCNVTVETDPSGKLYANMFKLAVDGNSGLERIDVLKR